MIAARLSSALIGVLAALALLGSCTGPSRDELLAGKPCDALGECAAGYRCDAATWRCLPEASGGGALTCSVAEDCPGLETDCTRRTCDGVCGSEHAPLGTACDFDGGARCDGEGRCVACVDSSDCPDGGVCDAFVCVPASCMDGLPNGDETDVDCGGSCDGCEHGQGCLDADDCTSGFCQGAGGQGGSMLGACAPCSDEADCPGGYCEAGVCLPDKADGESCDEDGECASGFCPAADGVCCDRACDALCEACTAAKTGGSDGSCAPVAAGTDPDLECLAMPAASCGSNGLGCSGSGNTCLLHDASTVCTPASCSAGVAQPEELCDGLGTCVSQAPVSCDPYVCDSLAQGCLGDCSGGGHDDCVSSHYCDGVACLPKKALGSACAAAFECQSDHCIDGVCCARACTAFCEACSVAKTGAPDGQCEPVLPGTDPDDECPPSNFCNGMGGCAPMPLGSSCTSGAECGSGHCVDGVCCNTACSGTCQACAATLSGGTDGTCANIPSGLDPQRECGANSVCNGVGVCKRVDGASCNNNNQCLSGDCCTSGCASGWQNTCLPTACKNTLLDGSETDIDCGGPVCRRCGSGKTCGVPADCLSGSCVLSVCQ